MALEKKSKVKSENKLKHMHKNNLHVPWAHLSQHLTNRSWIHRFWLFNTQMSDPRFTQIAKPSKENH